MFCVKMFSIGFGVGMAVIGGIRAIRSLHKRTYGFSEPDEGYTAFNSMLEAKIPVQKASVDGSNALDDFKR